MSEGFTPGLINTTVDQQMELISGKIDAEKRNLCAALVALGMNFEHIKLIMDRSDIAESVSKRLQEVLDECVDLIENVN